MDKQKEPQKQNSQGDMLGYKSLDIRYVLYVLLVVGVTLGLLFIVNIIDGAIHPVSPTGSAVYTPQIMDDYLNNPNDLMSLFGKAESEIPGTLKVLFGDEKVNTKITRMDGSIVDMAIETENGELKNAYKGFHSEPTMNVEISENTIKRIYESQNPVDDVEDALETGEIKYDSQRFTTSVKMGILNTAINIMSWFS